MGGKVGIHLYDANYGVCAYGMERVHKEPDYLCSNGRRRRRVRT